MRYQGSPAWKPSPEISTHTKKAWALLVIFRRLFSTRIASSIISVVYILKDCWALGKREIIANALVFTMLFYSFLTCFSVRFSNSFAKVHIFSKPNQKLWNKGFFPYFCKVINENTQYYAITNYWMGWNPPNRIDCAVALRRQKDSGADEGSGQGR